MDLLSSEENEQPSQIMATSEPIQKSNVFQKETTEAVLEEWEKEGVDLKKAASKISQSKKKKKILIQALVVGIIIVLVSLGKNKLNQNIIFFNIFHQKKKKRIDDWCSCHWPRDHKRSYF